MAGASVCIIGGGLSGLVTAHEVQKAGMRPTLFELRGDIGGLFNREDTEFCKSEQVSSYDALHLTISNYLMAYGDEPPPETEQRRFWSRKEYLSYLQGFADKRGLRECFRFTTRVLSVARMADGRYKVEVENLTTKGHSVEYFDAVAVCTGTNARPVVPQVPGIESFVGEVRHAGAFNGSRNDPAYVDKRVLVVGFGESGADTLRAVSDVSRTTVLSLRSVPFIVQRLLHDETKYTVGEASDSITSPGHHLLYRSWWLWLIMLFVSLCYYLWTAILRILQSQGHRSLEELEACVPLAFCVQKRKVSNMEADEGRDAFGQFKANGKQLDIDTPWTEGAMQLQRKWNQQSRFQTFATKNYSSAGALIKPSTEINTSGIARIDGSTVHFKDGSKAEGVDTILWNTGFKDDLDYLAPELRPANGARSLFKNAFKPGQPPTLAFVGWARPSFGGVPICSEMVARYWALLLQGERTMPNEADALRVVEKDRQYYAEVFPESGLSTLIDLYHFMDSMSGLIGCRPRLWQYALTGHVDLIWKYFYGQHVASWYRLSGPGSDFKAHASVIRRLPVCLTPWNTVKHACANLVNSTGLLPPRDRFTLMEFFNM